MSRPPLINPELEERICTLRKAGHTIKEICAAENLTENRIQYVLKRNGLIGIRKAETGIIGRHSKVVYLIEVPELSELVKQFDYVGIEVNSIGEYLVTIGERTGAPAKVFNEAVRNAYSFALKGV